ncbi:MAG: CoA-binding protein [Candidatus Pacebacteria bacterium]|nr:CoA-binding protein [Candidatus Paceibacterota bacterium]
MSAKKTEKLNRIFNPSSIAIIGASDKEGSVGFGLVKNLTGAKGIAVFLINPYIKEINGAKTYPDIASTKKKIELAIIAVPAPIVPEILKQCIVAKAGGAIVVASGFGELGQAGKITEKEIAEMCQKAGMPLIGPNCLGIINNSIGLNASFAPISPKKGNIALLSQSGALIDVIIDRAAEEKFGFSKIISYGNEADCSLAGFLEYLKTDKDTKAIIVYLESIKNGREFMDIAKSVSVVKPIIVIKAGRGEIGQQAAATHTGALSTNYEIYKTALRQANVGQADSLDELLDSAKALSLCPRCANGIGVVTNGGGLGVLAADACEENGIVLPDIQPQTIKILDKEKCLEKISIKRNPLDIIGDALPERYEAGVGALLQQNDISGLLVLQSVQIMTRPMENAKIIVSLRKKFPTKPIICCFAGNKLVAEAADYLESNGIPNYNDPKRAVKAFKHLIFPK